MRFAIRHFSLLLALSPALLAAASGCSDTSETPDAGFCQPDPTLDSVCNGGVDGGTAASVGLAGWSCTGGARPDEAPKYIDGVPQGTVCADQGAAGDGGVQSFCCTTATTTCAFNPVAICDPSTYGFQCLGANRPESLNPEIKCGQGVREGDYINYCCAGKLPKDGCTQTDTIKACKDTVNANWTIGLTGFVCDGKNLPRAEQLGENKSRADIYYFLCPTPTLLDENQPDGQVYYCCLTPAMIPEGGTCTSHTSVPGCKAGRFGFACYDRDTPEQDYRGEQDLKMFQCDPGFPGISAEGYSATLYCCDYQPPK